MRKQMRLRGTILITTILITSVVVLGFGYASERQFTKLLTERMVDDYGETVNTLHKNVETLILYTQDFAKYMSLDETVMDTILKYETMPDENDIRTRMALQEQWNQMSTRLLYATSMLYSLDIYAGEQLVYSYYEDPVDSADKTIPQKILKEALEQAPPVWTDLLTLKQRRSYSKREEYGFAVVKSVKLEVGEKIGVIAVYVRESSFSDILTPVDKKEGNRFYLVNGEDKIISAVDKSELYGDVREILEISEEDYRTCMEEGMCLKTQRGKDPLLYVSRAIGQKGVKLICETEMDELGEQQANLRLFIGMTMAAAIVLASIGAWFASVKVTKPLGELMEIMGKIKDEGSALRFPKGTKGEIGILGERFNELMDRLDETLNQVYREQRQRRHNELRLLQAQISPHFLYNTLGVISSFIKLGMNENALTTIQNLVSFYRLSLSSGKEIITVKEEVELTKNYLELQQLRYIEYMEYTLECEESVENFNVPKLTIQPLVENVLQHGLKPGGEKCRIQISLTLDGMWLKICVYDNGAGMKAERLEQVRLSLETGERVTKSFGVLNVNQRLKLVYGDAYHMEIDSEEGEYTRMTLYIHIEKGEQETKDV